METIQQQMYCFPQWKNCFYDPKVLAGPYFSVGEFLALFALIFTIYQLLNPLRKARWDLAGKSTKYFIYGSTFIAFILLLLPIIDATTAVEKVGVNVTYLNPLLWEFLAAVLCFIILAVLFWLLTHNAKLREKNMELWVGCISTQLYSNKVESFDAITRILDAQNIKKLIAISIKSEQNLANKKNLANYLLLNLSDQKFCHYCVVASPSFVLDFVEQAIEQAKLIRFDCFHPCAGVLQQLSRAAILNDDSLYAREIGFEGFSFTKPFGSLAYQSLDLLDYARILYIPSHEELLNEGVRTRCNEQITIALKEHIEQEAPSSPDFGVAYAFKKLAESMTFIGWKADFDEEGNIYNAAIRDVSDAFKTWADILHKASLDFTVSHDNWSYDLASALAHASIELMSNILRAKGAQKSFRPYLLNAFECTKFVHLEHNGELPSSASVCRAVFLEKLRKISVADAEHSRLHEEDELVLAIFIAIGIEPRKLGANHTFYEYADWIRSELNRAALTLLNFTPSESGVHENRTHSSVLPDGWVFDEQHNAVVTASTEIKSKPVTIFLDNRFTESVQCPTTTTKS